MTQYAYTATNKAGEKVKGMISAPNELEVRVVLRAQNLRPVKISKAGALDVDLSKFLKLGSGVSQTDLILFTRQLSILISSGVPLVQGLDAIIPQIQNSTMKQTVMSIKEKVTGGAFLWESLKAHKDIFPEIYTSMVRAGEAAGALDAILKRLIKYLEDANKLKKIVQGAMIYPIAISIIGVGVVIIMMVFVIPKFEELLSSAGQELPEATRIVIAMSNFFQRNIMLILGGIAMTIAIVQRYLKSEEGRAFFDNYVLRVPLFGQLLLKVAVARFSRTMQTLLSSGINLLDAFDIVAPTVGNQTLSEELKKMRIQVEEGKTMSGVMAKSKTFPSMVTQMVTVGENTGNLDKMLDRVADYYEEEVQNLVGNMTKMIEPFILVVLGGFVGGLMIAMYLPIFKMAGGAGG